MTDNNFDDRNDKHNNAQEAAKQQPQAENDAQKHDPSKIAERLLARSQKAPKELSQAEKNALLAKNHDQLTLTERLVGGYKRFAFADEKYAEFFARLNTNFSWLSWLASVILLVTPFIRIFFNIKGFKKSDSTSIPNFIYQIASNILNLAFGITIALVVGGVISLIAPILVTAGAIKGVIDGIWDLAVSIKRAYGFPTEEESVHNALYPYNPKQSMYQRYQQEKFDIAELKKKLLSEILDENGKVKADATIDHHVLNELTSKINKRRANLYMIGLNIHGLAQSAVALIGASLLFVVPLVGAIILGTTAVYGALDASYYFKNRNKNPINKPKTKEEVFAELCKEYKVSIDGHTFKNINRLSPENTIKQSHLKHEAPLVAPTSTDKVQAKEKIKIDSIDTVATAAEAQMKNSKKRNTTPSEIASVEKAAVKQVTIEEEIKPYSADTASTAAEKSAAPSPVNSEQPSPIMEKSITANSERVIERTPSLRDTQAIRNPQSDEEDSDDENDYVRFVPKAPQPSTERKHNSETDVYNILAGDNKDPRSLAKDASKPTTRSVNTESGGLTSSSDSISASSNSINESSNSINSSIGITNSMGESEGGNVIIPRSPSNFKRSSLPVSKTTGSPATPRKAVNLQKDMLKKDDVTDDKVEKHIKLTPGGSSEVS